MQALLNNENKVKAMSFDCIWKLGFKIRKTNIKIYKIDDFTLKTFEIIIANFQVKDKFGRLIFF